MEPLELSEEQKTKLDEMLKDLFHEYAAVYVQDVKGNVAFVMYPSNFNCFEIHWFELCSTELPKRLAMSSGKVDVDAQQYYYVDSMMKRMLQIHETYKTLGFQHPVDFLYEQFIKITK